MILATGWQETEAVLGNKSINSRQITAPVASNAVRRATTTARAKRRLMVKHLKRRAISVGEVAPLGKGTRGRCG